MRNSPTHSEKSKKSILTVPILLLFCCINSRAQHKISGIITGTNNLPLESATIINTKINVQTISKADGSYSITAKKGDILIISFVGYTSGQIEVGDNVVINIALNESIPILDDVVMLGYSNQKVKEITGSVAVVKAKDLTAVPAGQIEQMLQGRVAGLNVITSGMPGGGSNVRIHGIGNFGDVTPLYIIDGVQGNINNLNPDDIESLQVLKDAGAYSIYGVRGANGVIVVTTKSGKIGKIKINYDFYIGTTRPTKPPDILSPQETADLTWLALKNSGYVDANGNPIDPYYGNGPTAILPDYLVAGPYTGLSEGDPAVTPDLYNIDFRNGPLYPIIKSNKSGEDWYHQLFKPAISQNHTITGSGGNDKNKYLFSLGYLDQQGTLLYSYLKRFTARINTTFSVNDKIRVGENLQLSFRDNPQIGTQRGPNNNEINAALWALPILPVYDIKGNFASLDINTLAGNPIARRYFSKNNKTDYWDIMGDAWGEIDFMKNVTFRTRFGGALTYHYFYDYSLFSYVPVNNLPNNSFNEASGYNSSYTWTNTMNFSRTFNKIHTIKVLAGTEYIRNYNRQLGGNRTGYYTNDVDYRFLTNGNPATQTNYSFAGISTLYSFIGSANYQFKDRYYFTATLRNDGSSVFGHDNRYGWFPSVSAAWRITQEKFLRALNWLTDLKLRASWGKSGFYGNTDPQNQYTLYGGTVADSYYDIYGVSAGAIQQGFRVTRIGEPKTGWQEDMVLNAGIESILWQGKLRATIDVYKKRSKGLLFPVTFPDILGGATPPNINIGDVQNTGFDILLGSEGKLSKSLRWNTTITITSYKSKILKINNLPFFDAPINEAGYFVRNAIGHPMGTFYGYKVVGLFQSLDDVNKSALQRDAAPGRFKYLDADKDGQISDNDRVYFGNPNPKFTAGLNAGIVYKNFDLSAFFYGSFGNDVFNIQRFTTDFIAGQLGPFVSAKSKSALYDSWTPQHQNAKTPIAEENFNFSNNGGVTISYFLEDGSYFRNKLITLGYTLSKKSLQRIKIENIRIYVQAMNLFTITKYSGLDPELSGFSDAYGIDFGNYPNNQKQYLVGVNVKF